MDLPKLIIRNIIWRGLFYFVSMVVNVAMVRMLGANLSGELYFLLNNLSLALLIGSMSFEAGIIYYVSKSGILEKSLAKFSLIWTLLISGAISLLFFVFYNEARIFDERLFFFASFAFCAGNILNTYFNAFFYSHNNYRTPNLIAVIINLILLLCLPWKPAWLGFIDLKTFLMIFFMAQLLQGLIVCIFWFAGRKYEVPHTSSIKEISPVLKYSLAALVGNVTYFILYRVDYWFVEYYCTPKALGNYIQVSRVCQLLILPCVIVAGTLFPQSSKDKFSFETIEFRKLARIIIAGYLFIGMFLLAFGKWLIIALWGNDYDQMYQPLLLTMPGVLFLGLAYLFSPTFAGKGGVNYNVVISFLSLIVVLISNLLLVPVWGINGAAVATTFGFTAMLVLYLVFAGAKYRFSVRTLFTNS